MGHMRPIIDISEELKSRGHKVSIITNYACNQNVIKMCK